MAFAWLNTLLANNSERKYSIIIATVATVAVASTVIWSTFFTEQKQAATPYKQSITVNVTEKPNIQVQQTVHAKQPVAAKKSTPIKQAAQIKPAVQVKATTRQVSSQKEAQQTTKKKQAVLGQGKLYVQVGAYKKSNLARLTFEKMKAKYKKAKIVSKSGLHAVWVGPVVTRAEADRLKKHIQRRDNIAGFITSEK